MTRNYRNYLIWEEPDGNRLEVVPMRDSLNTEEIQNIFTTQISDDLLRQGEALLTNAQVQISCSSSGGDVTIFLSIIGAPPYIIRRDGVEIESRLQPSDFPYTDLDPNQSQQAEEICYEIESDRGNTNEVCCTVQP